MRKFYNYMGAKTKHTVFLNEIFKNSVSKNYCEPFLGSAIVFLNLEKEFDKYFLNDLQKENLLCFNKKLNRDFIVKTFYNSVKKYPQKNKEAYYKFRDELLNVCNDDLEKAVYIFRIYNECINSMPRFNKNKFNQSYGDRKTLNQHLNNYIDAVEFSKTKNTIITNTSFENLLYKEDCLYFFDPPYITNEMGCNCDFNKEKLNILINFMLNTKEEFVYTDIENDFNKCLLSKFNWSYLDKIKNISPNRKQEKTNREIIVWNFKVKDIFDI